MCISVATGRCPRCPVSRGHDNNAKVATQYFSVIRNLERALGQRGNGAMHINCLCGDTRGCVGSGGYWKHTSAASDKRNTRRNRRTTPSGIKESSIALFIATCLSLSFCLFLSLSIFSFLSLCLFLPIFFSLCLSNSLFFIPLSLSLRVPFILSGHISYTAQISA